jgi:hypothetical protein
MTLPPGARDVRRSGGGCINQGWHPPMLVHGVLFGGGCCEAAQRIALRYAA